MSLISLIIMEKNSNLKPKLFSTIGLKINLQMILKMTNRISLIMKINFQMKITYSQINNSIILLMMNKIILSMKINIQIKIDKKNNLNNLKKNKNQ